MYAFMGLGIYGYKYGLRFRGLGVHGFMVGPPDLVQERSEAFEALKLVASELRPEF